MDVLTKHVQQLAATADAATRQKLLVLFRDLAHSLESPEDTLNRIGWFSNLQTANVRMGGDLKVFRFIAKAETAVSLGRIKEATGVDSEFMDRYVRYLASVGTLTETGPNMYTANRVTKNLTEPLVEAGICHCFETFGPMCQELPNFMKETRYTNPTDPRRTELQATFQSDMTTYAWFAVNPDSQKWLHDWLPLRRGSDYSWLSQYPFSEKAKDWDLAAPLYVDMGGGFGHLCAKFKERFPQIPGRVILQDLPHIIKKAIQTPKVENMAHDFFEPQRIKGAKFYYTGRVLHNHPDEKVRLFLRNLMTAMSDESVILLDEWTLPQTEVNSFATTMDFAMMMGFATKQRTVEEWKALADSVGLEIVEFYTYNPAEYETVMELRKKTKASKKGVCTGQ